MQASCTKGPLGVWLSFTTSPWERFSYQTCNIYLIDSWIDLPYRNISGNNSMDISYATLTLWRIFLRIWIFEFRGEFAQKLRLDSEYFHLGHPSVVLGPRPLLTNILRIYYECLPTLANALRIANERCQRLRTLYQRYQWLTNAYENRRRMTVFATFAEI